MAMAKKETEIRSLAVKVYGGFEVLKSPHSKQLAPIFDPTLDFSSSSMRHRPLRSEQLQLKEISSKSYAPKCSSSRTWIWLSRRLCVIKDTRQSQIRHRTEAHKVQVCTVDKCQCAAGADLFVNASSLSIIPSTSSCYWHRVNNTCHWQYKQAAPSYYRHQRYHHQHRLLVAASAYFATFPKDEI